MIDQFTHLHVHTEYSLANGMVRIPELIAKVKASGQTAVAITDQFNVFGLVKFYKEALKQGIKPILGCELAVYESDELPLSRLVVLAKNQKGYKNMKTLLSRAYVEGQKQGVPAIDKAWLTPSVTEGLIGLSAASAGDIGQAIIKGDDALAKSRAQAWSVLFPQRFYLELIRTGRPNDDLVTAASVELAQELSLPVVASNDVHFGKADDFEAHEARVCINEGTVLANPNREKHFSELQYLTDSQTMVEKFADVPSAITNAVEIAKRCTVLLEFDNPQLPQYPIPEGMTEAQYFVRLSEEGLEERLEALFPDADLREQERPVFEARLQEELKVIQSMGFSGYFLIVADFILWSREQKIPVGPGRGSGAGSLVAYALGITNIEPLRYDLLFERFLNPERVSMPDFDIDFCMERRDEVIAYVSKKYGFDRVSQIITYGSMNAKGVVRDAGRVLGYPYGLSDGLAKLIPFDLKMTLDKALDESSDLKKRYDNEDDVKEVMDLARSLEGLKRNVGKHAAGLVISPTDINDFTPVYCEQTEGNPELVSQFDKDDVESVGLVKFDFLGLRTLTVIDWALANIKKIDPSKNIDIDAIPLDDAKVYALLQAGRTTAVFQMESPGLQAMLKKLKPSEFEEVIAAVALYRPGPLDMGMDETFIKRKHGEEEVEYPHEDLTEILKPTFGVIVYQEQVMQIAQVLAGYSLGGADILRRAMGKKKMEEMATQRQVFTDGAVARGVDATVATEVFDLMETFANYGFNKSHSAAYALIAYQTAWLKTYYPAAFMAAVLSSDMDSTEKVVHLIEESRSLGLKVLPPDVNYSQYPFSVVNDEEVIYGLGAIKGVGSAAIDSIISHREKGPYTDLHDFCMRIESGKVNKRVIEALIRSGAMDSLAPVSQGQERWEVRATLLKSMPEAMQRAEQEHRNAEAGQDDLFASDASETEKRFSYQNAPSWSDDERLYGERDTLGLFLTGHPINQYLPELENFVSHKISDLEDKYHHVCFAGMLIEKQVRETKTGKRMVIFKMDDRSSQKEIVLFSEQAEEYEMLLEKDNVLVVVGSTREDRFRGGFQVQVKEMYDLSGARQEYIKYLDIQYRRENTPDAQILEETLRPFIDGSCHVKLSYQTSHERGSIWLDKAWQVNPKDALLERLKALPWVDAVEKKYV